MSETILEVEAIEKRFGDVQAVDRLSFRVERGEIFAFLGPNGAGKTTTVRMLMGIIHPDAGQIRYALGPGAGPRPDPAALGYLPDYRGLYQDAQVLEILVYLGTLRRLERAAARQEARAWLERLELADRAEQKLETLSKGNQQKVQFIAAVLHRPRFAILDEPFSGFDPLNQERFSDIIRELRAEGMTILLSAHQMDLVERLADRALLMSRGRVVREGSMAVLKQGAGAGDRLRLRLAQAPVLADLEGHPEIVRVERFDELEIEVLLQRGEALSGVLGWLAERLVITAIHSEEASLHQVYVQELGEASPGEAV